MRTIRASEIGTYIFCARAWWYRIKGVPPENSEEMLAGSEFHDQHGGRVLLSNLQNIGGWILIMMAVILLAVVLTIKWLE